MIKNIILLSLITGCTFKVSPKLKQNDCVILVSEANEFEPSEFIDAAIIEKVGQKRYLLKGSKLSFGEDSRVLTFKELENSYNQISCKTLCDNSHISVKLFDLICK